MRRLAQLAGTSLSLIALYLILRNAFGATSIIRALGDFTLGVFRTLQWR